MRSKLEAISFIQLNKDVSSARLRLSTETLLPLLNEDIKSGFIEGDEITAESILRGILYLYAHDPNFKNREDYQLIIDSLGEESVLLSFIHSHVSDNLDLAYDLVSGFTVFYPESLRAAVLRSEYANLLFERDEDPRYLEESRQVLAPFKDTGDFRVLYHLAHLELFNQRYEEAKVLFIELLKHEEGKPFIEEISSTLRSIEEEQLFLKAKEALFDEHYDLAIKEFSSLDENFSKIDEVYFFLGLAHRSIDQFDQALYYFEKGMVITDDLSFRKEAALCLIYLERFGEAESMMRDILTREKDENVLLNLGISLLYQGKLDQSRHIFEELKDNETIGELATNWLNYLSTN